MNRQYQWRPLLCGEWVWTALTALTWTAVVLMVVLWRYLFVPGVALGVLMEVLLWWRSGARLSGRSLRQVWHAAWRRFWRVAAVAIVVLLLLLPAELLTVLPAVILTLAHWNAQQSVLVGDAPSMPVWVVYAMDAVWLVTCAVHVVLRLLVPSVLVQKLSSSKPLTTETATPQHA